MNYKHSSVIGAGGYYVDFVLVVETETAAENGTTSTEWVAQYYTLKDGESLVDTPRPHARINADDEGIITYKWDGAQWVEGATAEEIAQWEMDNPAPVATDDTEGDEDIWAEMAAAISEGVNEV